MSCGELEYEQVVSGCVFVMDCGKHQLYRKL